MTIEFRCLNCRSTLHAADEDAGQKTECEKCGIRVTIPQPIGGELTRKRLRPTGDVVAAGPPTLPQAQSVSPAAETLPHIPQITGKPKREYASNRERAHFEIDIPQIAEPTHRVDQRYFQIENQPRLGFTIDMQLPHEATSRINRQYLGDSAERIRTRLIQHLEFAPQYFERGALLLDIRRWHVDDAGHDVNIRLVGLVNSEEVSYYFYDHPMPESLSLHSSLFTGPLTMIRSIGRSISWALWDKLEVKSFHQRMVKRAVGDLTRVLDELVNRPVSRLEKLGRSLFG